MTPRIRLAAATAAALLLVTSAFAYAKPVPAPVVTPKPSGPVPAPYPDQVPPYPDPPPPPPPECPPSLCPKAGGTLQFAGGASTIEIESFSWGEASAADGPTTVNTSDPQEGGQVAGRPVHTSDPQEGGQVVGGPIYTSDPQEGGQVTTAGRKAGGGQWDSAVPRAEVRSPRDSSTGLATGRRMHKPMTMRRGSVDVTMPEGVCVAGAHYPTVTLRSGDTAYEMSDVTVASCTPVATAKGKKDKAKLDYMVVTMQTVLISG